jgi:hypothetical protein
VASLTQHIAASITVVVVVVVVERRKLTDQSYVRVVLLYAVKCILFSMRPKIQAVLMYMMHFCTVVGTILLQQLRGALSGNSLELFNPLSIISHNRIP